MNWYTLTRMFLKRKQKIKLKLKKWGKAGIACFPFLVYEEKRDAEFSPVDETAEGIVKITQYAKEQNVFHLNSNRPLYFKERLPLLEQQGIHMEVTEGTAFYEALQKTMDAAGTEYIYEAFQSGM